MKRQATLGDILVDDGIISQKEYQESVKVLEKSNLSLSQIIQKKGYAGEVDIIKSLARLHSMDFHEKLEFHNEEEIYNRIPFKLIQKSKMVPFHKENNTIFVAINEPTDLHPQDDIRFCLKEYKVKFVLSPETEITRIIHAHFDKTTSDAKEMMDEMVDGGLDDLDLDNDSLDMSNDAPIIKMVNVILSQGVSERASDIHIEAYEKTVTVRYRVDGILHKVLSPPKSYHAGIVSRIKIMSNLNIAENRLPQDGRIKLKLAGKDIDIRVSTIPCQYGERVVMRLLNKTDQKYSLDMMGFTQHLMDPYRKLIYQPHGIILVTGPTGSGKSTTLYSSLTELNTPERNIITCEDPVEYQIDGISQMQMQEKIGMTFATGLRAILRQDPDVVMVGEIRDEETARIAIQASLTGHLVFSTLHTNDAASAATRLIDMGIEQYLITSTVLGFIAQRLVRRICTDCRTSYEPDDKELESLGLRREDLQDGKLFKGAGCSKCMGTGYKGRIGIYELLVMNSEIKKAILRGADASELNDIAIATGMENLRRYGLGKVIEGVTTPDEILRVVS
ncbi:MAG: type II secretion system ATPase GspE [Spirochaetota bacterium]